MVSKIILSNNFSSDGCTFVNHPSENTPTTTVEAPKGVSGELSPHNNELVNFLKKNFHRTGNLSYRLLYP